MLQRAILRIGAQTNKNLASVRWISKTTVLKGSQTTMADVVASTSENMNAHSISIDHLMTVERAAQLMAEHHVNALPIVENEKVVGLFTEHDYFDKVLNKSHSAVRTAKVSEVATMGARLVVAYPEDTVEGCLEVMTKKNLNALPVVEHDGHVVGTVSMMGLTKEMLEPDQEVAESKDFSEPSHFPENIMHAGSGLHDDITAAIPSTEELRKLYGQLKHDLEEQATEAVSHPSSSFDSAAAERFKLNANLDEMAAESFSEASTFPEYTPSEDLLFTQTHGARTADTPYSKEEAKVWKEEDKYAHIQGEILCEIETRFSEPSDFPEPSSIDEVIAVREREKMRA
jgi:CBS domain-containing protein